MHISSWASYLSQQAGLKNPLQIFRDGQEVIDYLSQRGAGVGGPATDAPPGLMLLDLKMPRKTGFEVLEWLRHQPRLKRLVVVVMSNVDPDAAEHDGVIAPSTMSVAVAV